MTTQAEAREAIYLRFVTLWGTRTPYTFDAEAYDPPANADWVRLSVRHNRSDQESLGPPGARKYLRGGQIVVQVFTPADTGREAADGHEAVLRTIFEGVTFSGVTVNDAVFTEIGPDGDYEQANYVADFEYTHTR